MNCNSSSFQYIFILWAEFLQGDHVLNYAKKRKSLMDFKLVIQVTRSVSNVCVSSWNTDQTKCDVSDSIGLIYRPVSLSYAGVLQLCQGVSSSLTQRKSQPVTVINTVDSQHCWLKINESSMWHCRRSNPKGQWCCNHVHKLLKLTLSKYIKCPQSLEFILIY